MSRSWCVQHSVNRGCSSEFKKTICCSAFIALAFQSSCPYKYLLKLSLALDLLDFDLNPISLWLPRCCLRSWSGLCVQEPLALLKVTNWYFHLCSRSISGKSAAAHSTYATEVGWTGAVIICKFCQRIPFHFCCCFFPLQPLARPFPVFLWLHGKCTIGTRGHLLQILDFIIFLTLLVAFSKDSEQCAKSLLGNSHN